MNPYHVLGVPPDADVEALRAAYRKLVRAHHPDRAPDEAARLLASERMVQINWAWHIVSDQGRRAAFDARFRLEQFEAARRQQEALRAQARGQVARGQQAHRADVLKAQAQRRAEQNQQTQNQARQTAQERAREQQFLEWQALERARRERAKQQAQPAADKRLSAEEKKRQNLARARLQRMRREDKRRSSTPSARRQLAEAARLFGQEGRASDAIAICHDVLRVDFRNVPARELLGDFYLRLGREDRALPLWEQALVLQPDNASVRRKLNALRPHDPRVYQSRPGMARPAQDRARAAMRPNHGRPGFWGRLRAALRGGL